MPTDLLQIRDRLWDVADRLRADAQLSSTQYSMPVLGLIFLRYADHRFTALEAELLGVATAVGSKAEEDSKSSAIGAAAPSPTVTGSTESATAPRSSRRSPSKEDYQAQGVMFLPAHARFSHLLALPESQDIGGAINEAMLLIEEENEDLVGVLPKTYNGFSNSTLVSLLKTFNSIPMDIEGDAFGKIYEYFLGKFAMSEGRGAGAFYTPTSIVKLIVEIIEPFHGRILDPACGSGGMFVQSARFVENHHKNPAAEIMVYGQEGAIDTLKLCKMNLAVHGLSGEIKQGNTYYEDMHDTVGRFDFVMANPPFNVDNVDKERIKDDRRFSLGMPTVDNGNYLWIQIFHSALKEGGRAGFVMANSASDARGSEAQIRERLIRSGHVDVMVAIGPNFFYTVTLPVTLWFLDKGKTGTERADKVLFIDARHTFRQIDRAHRDFSKEQLELLANIVRLYRGEQVEEVRGSSDLLAESFPEGSYRDVPGLCKTATLEEIEAQGWSLNPGRYVGVADRAPDEFEFAERLEELNEELEVLNVDARELEDRIAGNVTNMLARLNGIPGGDSD